MCMYLGHLFLRSLIILSITLFRVSFTLYIWVQNACLSINFIPYWYLQMIRGRSYPMSFNYIQDDFNMEECLRNDVQQMLHKNKRRSSSSDSETDNSTEMTVLRPKLARKRSRIASDKSYGEKRWFCNDHLVHVFFFNEIAKHMDWWHPSIFLWKFWISLLSATDTKLLYLGSHW